MWRPTCRSLDPFARLRYGRGMRTPSDPQNRDRPQGPKPAKVREDRLKAALKANMARRKAQAKARNAGETASGETDDN
ncbi:MAG: hypothetical protein C0524_17470 [Rhodobacter sp.]|nr:hypothetical protein [Rhodobacter sp.]